MPVSGRAGLPARPSASLAGSACRQGDVLRVLRVLALGSALQRERWSGTLELLVGTPTHFALVLLPITIAMSTIGVYSMVTTLLWGRFVFGIDVHVAHPWLFVL